MKEVEILKNLDHPHIIKVFEFFDTSTHIYIIMEFLSGGDLFDRINKERYFSQKKAMEIIQPLLEAIAYLHSQKIVHRDIKPANLFLDREHRRIKIGDLNIARIIEGDLAETQIGTPYYLAPEIWQKNKYDEKCDIYSLGCILFELAALKHPFQSSNKSELH